MQWENRKEKWYSETKWAIIAWVRLCVCLKIPKKNTFFFSKIQHFCSSSFSSPPLNLRWRSAFGNDDVRNIINVSKTGFFSSLIFPSKKTQKKETTLLILFIAFSYNCLLCVFVFLFCFSSSFQVPSFCSIRLSRAQEIDFSSFRIIRKLLRSSLIVLRHFFIPPLSLPKTFSPMIKKNIANSNYFWLWLLWRVFFKKKSFFFTSKHFKFHFCFLFSSLEEESWTKILKKLWLPFPFFFLSKFLCFFLNFSSAQAKKKTTIQNFRVKFRFIPDFEHLWHWDIIYLFYLSYHWQGKREREPFFRQYCLVLLRPKI